MIVHSPYRPPSSLESAAANLARYEADRRRRRRDAWCDGLLVVWMLIVLLILFVTWWTP